MTQNPCPWTAAAVASQEHALRAWGAAHDTRHLGQVVDPRNEKTVQGIHSLARKEERMAEALEWARDFFILAAQHPDEMQAFREHLERRQTDSLSARTAVAPGAETRPVNGSVLSILARLTRKR